MDVLNRGGVGLKMQWPIAILATWHWHTIEHATELQNTTFNRPH